MGRGPPSRASEQMHPSHFQNDAIGTKRTFHYVRDMSVVGGRADMAPTSTYVCL